MAKTTSQRKGRKAPRQSRTGLVLGAGTVGLVAVGVALILIVGGGAGSAKAAPAWEAQTIDGQKISGVGLKGDVYAIDFFFTWCPICAQQLPHKKALVAEFSDREDFHFISVSADPNDSPAKLDEYRKTRDASWPFVSDKYGLYQKFKVNSRPFIVFVDRDGAIVKTITRVTPADDLIPLVAELLEKSATAADETGAPPTSALAVGLAAPASRALLSSQVKR